MNTVGIEHCIGVMAKCGLEEHITAHPSRLWFAMANVMPQDSTCAGSSDADRSIDYHMSACAHLAICSSVWRGPPRAANMGPNAHTHTHCATTKIPSAVLHNLSPSTRHGRKQQQQQTCMHDYVEITHLCGRPHDHRSRPTCLRDQAICATPLVHKLRTHHANVGPFVGWRTNAWS
jgi:hypothetical protein